MIVTRREKTLFFWVFFCILLSGACWGCCYYCGWDGITNNDPVILDYRRSERDNSCGAKTQLLLSFASMILIKFAIIGKKKMNFSAARLFCSNIKLKLALILLQSPSRLLKHETVLERNLQSHMNARLPFFFFFD